MKRLTLVLCLCLLTLFSLMCPTLAANTTNTTTEKRVTLEGLLKAGEFDYIKKDDFYKVPVEFDDATLMFFCAEEKIFENPDVYVATISCCILQLPENSKPSAAMLKKIAELNEKLWVGRIGYDSKYNSVDYNSSLWLKNASVETLGAELALGHGTCTNAKKELKPFLTE